MKQQYGTNVTAEAKGGSLILTIDPEARGGVSASGKSEKIASTGGSVDLAAVGFPGVKLGLNVYLPR